MHIHSSSLIDFFFLSQLFYAALLCHYECLLSTTCKAKICIAIMKALYTWVLHLYGRRVPRFRSFCVRYLMTKQSLLSFVARKKISMVLIFPSSLKIVVHLLLVLQHFRLCYNCVTVCCYNSTDLFFKNPFETVCLIAVITTLPCRTSMEHFSRNSQQSCVNLKCLTLGFVIKVCSWNMIKLLPLQQ